MTNVSTLNTIDTTNSNTHLPSPWENDSTFSHCHECKAEFTPTNRRHHCRLCGKIFCHDCSSHRSLIPPSSIVLIDKEGKNVNTRQIYTAERSVEDNRMLTYTTGVPPESESIHSLDSSGHTGGADTLLYGRGLEERYKLAREPLRVCDVCFEQLKPIQHELRASNSNAVRYNSIDPTDIKRLFNSPLAFTLGHEVRKAAYTLNNLLPLPTRSSLLFPPIKETYTLYNNPMPNPVDECKNVCKTISPSLGDLDGVRIPARLLELAKGIAVLTVFKGGFMIGGEIGSGLVVARLSDDNEDGDENNTRWSAPSSIGALGFSWGALAGAQVSDHVFLLMTDAAVELMATSEGSIQLGADIGVAVGPLGRSFEANVGATKSSGMGTPALAPIYTYSLSKGLYAGVSLDGKVIMTRHRVNERFYGHRVSPTSLLNGDVPSPPAAQPLYDALRRCHVYATNSAAIGGVAADIGEMCRGGQTVNRAAQGKFNSTFRSNEEFHHRDNENYFMDHDEWDEGGGDFSSVTLPSAPNDQSSHKTPSEFSLSASESSF